MQLFIDLKNAINANSDRNSFFINGVFYSYSDFAKCISSIRHAIKQNTTDEEIIVGLVANDDIETYAAIIALWFEGKAYVPLAPETPRDRNENIIQQAFIKTIIDSSNSPLFLEYRVRDRTALSRKELDFYFKEYNFAIEFQGDYWHCNPAFYSANKKIRSGMIASDIWIRDKWKFDTCKDKDIYLMQIWESDWNSNKEQIKQQILDILRAKNAIL